MDIKMQTKDRIKYEACIAFSEDGYLGASMRNIAESVGIKAASIYSHYESKEILFIEVFENCMENYHLYIHINHEGSDISPKEELLNILRRKVEFSNDYPYEFNFLARYTLFPPKEIEEELRKRFIIKGDKTYVENYREIYDELIKENIIITEPTFDEFMAYFQGVFIVYIIQNKGLSYFNTQQSVEDIFNLHWEGFKAR